MESEDLKFRGSSMSAVSLVEEWEGKRSGREASWHDLGAFWHDLRAFGDGPEVSWTGLGASWGGLG